MKIKEIFDNYLNFCQIYRKQGTYNAYNKSYVFLLRIFSELNITDSNEITSDVYHKLISYIKSNSSKKNSKINSLISDMMTAIRYSDIKIAFKPFKLIDDTTHYKSLNRNELHLLIEYLESLDLSISNNLPWVSSFYIMLDSGLRKNELLHIKSENVDLIQNLIYLDVTKNKKRVVKFGVLSKKHIEKLLKLKKEYLLWNVLRNEKLSKRSLERFIEKVNKNINLPSGNVHPHRLRKTFATMLLKSGCPITSIQKLLGHSSIVMTMIYLDIDFEMIEKDYSEFYPY